MQYPLNIALRIGGNSALMSQFMRSLPGRSFLKRIHFFDLGIKFSFYQRRWYNQDTVFLIVFRFFDPFGLPDRLNLR